MSQSRPTRNGARFRRSTLSGYGWLALFWAVQVCVGMWWLDADTLPPTYDMAGHATVAVGLSRAPFVTNPWIALKAFLNVVPYPPLVQLVSVPFVYLFGTPEDAVLGAQAVFGAVLFFSTYELGRRLDQPSTGLAAAFLLGMYPIIYGLSRLYLLDIPLVAMVTLTICFLVLTDGFRSLKMSLLFGLAAGLGMLTKWTLAVFLAAPFLIIVAGMRTGFTLKRLRNALLAVLTGGLIAAPWYLWHLEDLRSFLAVGGVYAAKEGDPLICSWQSWTYYADALVNQLIFLPFVVLFLVGLVLLLAKRKPDRSLVLLFAWIIVPYLAFSGFVNKNDRYVTPYLPSVALITALGLAQIRKGRAVRMLWAVIGVYACIQFAGLSFGLSQHLPNGMWAPRITLPLGSNHLAVYAESAHIASPPHIQEWHIQDILEQMLQDRADLGQNDGLSHLVVVPDRPYFEPQGFVFYVEAAQLPIKVHWVTGVLDIDAASQMETGDYVVTKTGTLGPAWSLQEAVPLTQALRDPASELGRQFVQIGEYPLPDGSVACLYRRVHS